MNEENLIEKLSELVENLGWDYDRMSQAGKATYEEICSILARLTQ